MEIKSSNQFVSIPAHKYSPIFNFSLNKRLMLTRVEERYGTLDLLNGGIDCPKLKSNIFKIIWLPNCRSNSTPIENLNEFSPTCTMAL